MKKRFDPATAPTYLKGVYSDYQDTKEQLIDSYNVRDYLGKAASQVTDADKKTAAYKRYKNTVNKAVYRLTKNFKKVFARTALSSPQATNVIFEDVPLFDALRYTLDNFEGSAMNYIQDLEEVNDRITLQVTINTLDGSSMEVIDRVKDIQSELEAVYKQVRVYFDKRRKEIEKQTKVKLSGKSYDDLVLCTLKEVSLYEESRVFLFLDIVGQ